MNDNEKLIEEARRTPQHAPKNLIPLVLRLADALEAAEKAHTPTDDEREALLNAEGWPIPAVVDIVMERWSNDNDTIRRGGGDWSWKGLAETAIQSLAQAGMLRRTEVPEPSRQIRECMVCGEKVTMSNATEAWEKRHKHAEPQGEPSNEQVNHALSELRKADYWAWKAMSPHGMRAALRAANEVR